MSIMDILNIWIPIIGLLFISLSINEFYFKSKIAGVWYAYIGACCLLFLAAAQFANYISNFSEPKMATQPADTARIAGSPPETVINPAAQPDTRKRSLVIVEYPTKAPDIDRSPMSTGIKVNYILKNIGELPAIVTDVIAHMYLSENEPDPDSKESEAFIEDARRGGKDDTKIALNGANSITLDPGKLFAAEEVFGFRSNKIDALSVGGQLPRRFAVYIWLLVVVKYRDAYSNDRETSFWVHIAGAGAMATKNKKYNYER